MNEPSSDMLAKHQALSSQLNMELFEKISSRDPAVMKEAEDSINAYTLKKMREEYCCRYRFCRILPPLPITNDELDRPYVDPSPEPSLWARFRWWLQERWRRLRCGCCKRYRAWRRPQPLPPALPEPVVIVANLDYILVCRPCKLWEYLGAQTVDEGPSLGCGADVERSRRAAAKFVAAHVQHKGLAVVAGDELPEDYIPVCDTYPCPSCGADLWDNDMAQTCAACGHDDHPDADCNCNWCNWCNWCKLADVLESLDDDDEHVPDP